MTLFDFQHTRFINKLPSVSSHSWSPIFWLHKDFFFISLCEGVSYRIVTRECLCLPSPNHIKSFWTERNHCTHKRISQISQSMDNPVLLLKLFIYFYGGGAIVHMRRQRTTVRKAVFSFHLLSGFWGLNSKTNIGCAASAFLKPSRLLKIQLLFHSTYIKSGLIGKI